MNDILNIFCTILGVGMDLVLLSIFLKRSNCNISKTLRIVGYSIYECVLVIMLFLELPFYIRMSVVLSMTFILIRWFYKVKNIVQVIKISSTYFIILTSGELVTVAWLMILGNQFSIEIFMDDFLLWILSTIMAKIISLLFIITIGKFIDKSNVQLTCLEKILTVFPLLATMITLLAMTSLVVSPRNYNIQNLTRVLILITIVMAIYTLMQVAFVTFYLDVKKKNNEIEILQMKNSMALKIYEERLEMNTEIHKIAHDIKNHLYYLESIMGENGSKGSIYLDKLKGRIERCENTISTKCDILDVLIRGKCDEMSELEIQYDIDINFECGIFIEELDIVALFGNLIDNAIEACARVDSIDKKICIYCNKIEEFIALKVINSSNNQYSFENGKLATIKYDKRNHGIGLISVKETVEKYNGKYTYKIEDGYYIANVVIPIP